MATNTKEMQPEDNPAELHDIDKLRLLKHTPLAICRGAMEMMGWYPGKHVTEAEYDAAVTKFRDAPCGKKVR